MKLPHAKKALDHYRKVDEPMIMELVHRTENQRDADIWQAFEVGAKLKVSVAFYLDTSDINNLEDCIRFITPDDVLRQLKTKSFKKQPPNENIQSPNY